jgi:hypothetical protein
MLRVRSIKDGGVGRQPWSRRYVQFWPLVCPEQQFDAAPFASIPVGMQMHVALGARPEQHWSGSPPSFIPVGMQQSPPAAKLVQQLTGLP